METRAIVVVVVVVVEGKRLFFCFSEQLDSGAIRASTNIIIKHDKLCAFARRTEKRRLIVRVERSEDPVVRCDRRTDRRALLAACEPGEVCRAH